MDFDPEFALSLAMQRREPGLGQNAIHAAGIDVPVRKLGARGPPSRALREALQGRAV